MSKTITILDLIRVWAIKSENPMETFFNSFAIDNRIDKSLLYSEFIRVYGGDYSLYNNSDDLRYFMANYFKSKQNDYSHIIDVLLSEYNPLHNYDRTETRKTNGKWIDNKQDVGSNENKVSAFNSTTYQPSSRNEDTNSSITNGDKEETETIRTMGNIGITTSQQMITEELKLRINNNIISVIIKDIGEKFTLGVW